MSARDGRRPLFHAIISDASLAAVEGHDSTREISSTTIGSGNYSICTSVLSFTELSNGSFMYTAEICVDFDLYKVNRSLWPLHDEALLSTVLLSTSALRDYALQQSPTTTTRFHLVRTLSLLNDKLSDKSTCILDSTIFLTVCLAVMAGIFGDTAAARAHLSGLQKIVALRGGTTYFRQHPKLQHKLESLDLLCCLAFDCKPRFLGSHIDWRVPCLPHLSKPISNVTELEISLEIFDSRLLATFYDLRQLASLVNEHNERRSRLSADVFQPALSSIQARLLHLEGVLRDSASEWFCLGMLTFIAAMFRPPGPKLEYPHLTHRLRLSGQRIDVKLPKLRILVFWFLVVSGTVVFDHDEPWLCRAWSEVVEAVLSWNEAREYLQRVVWIGCIQDEVGKRTFTTINSRIHLSRQNP
ncbi:hypothetical protein FDECE_11359 [Fusarium decemcellulare]|nr:hypothetical protein FDECE_11359 [Fusarium decemcellulare]